MLGHYVQYKNNAFIVVQERGDMVLLANGHGSKTQVSVRSVVMLNHAPAALKRASDGNEYLVTIRGAIFSCKTGSLMKWAENHGLRKQLTKTEAIM